jgi:hypothetical protein
MCCRILHFIQNMSVFSKYNITSEYCNTFILYPPNVFLFYTHYFHHRSNRSGSAEVMSEITEEMTFHQMVLDRTKTRKHMESRGREGQKKQAEDVNGQFVLLQCQRTEIK